jgi:hypothetical protein
MDDAYDHRDRFVAGRECRAPIKLMTLARWRRMSLKKL